MVVLSVARSSWLVVHVVRLCGVKTAGGDPLGRIMRSGGDRERQAWRAGRDERGSYVDRHRVTRGMAPRPCPVRRLLPDPPCGDQDLGNRNYDDVICVLLASGERPKRANPGCSPLQGATVPRMSLLEEKHSAQYRPYCKMYCTLQKYLPCV